MEALIELTGVRKVYRMGDEKIVALDDVTLSFERGKTYCLLGTSGSGKSTLLNILAGLEKPTRGSIRFNLANMARGQTGPSVLEKMSERELAIFRQHYIGFVFQSYNLLPTLTALENVTLPLIFRRVPKRRRNKTAKNMLKSVGLSGRARHKPSELSGGQQQRVSIARAFVNNPQVVFADEPTGNLDTKTTFEMMDLITGIAAEHNQTLIIVTHDVEIAGYADRIIRLRDGKVESVEDVPAEDRIAKGGSKPKKEEPNDAEVRDTEEAAEVSNSAADAGDNAGDGGHAAEPRTG